MALPPDVIARAELPFPAMELHELIVQGHLQYKVSDVS